MKLHRNTILLLFVLASCLDRNYERKEIVKTWKTYQVAFSNNVGEECSKYIDSASIKYYDHLLDLIKTADSTTVERLKMDQKLAVLLARHTLSQSQITRINGKGLFEALVKGGDGGMKEIPNFEFLSVTPRRAEAIIVDSNGKRGLSVEFNKENGVWKINLAYLSAQMSESDWTGAIRESAKTEREFVYDVLELANNTKPTDAVWHPAVK